MRVMGFGLSGARSHDADSLACPSSGLMCAGHVRFGCSGFGSFGRMGPVTECSFRLGLRASFGRSIACCRSWARLRAGLVRDAIVVCGTGGCGHTLQRRQRAWKAGLRGESSGCQPADRKTSGSSSEFSEATTERAS